MDICFRPQERKSPDGGRYFLKLPAVELDGVRHESVIGGSIEFGDMISEATASFDVTGRPEFYAVGDDLEPIEGWDPRTVEIPDGLDLNWQTIVEVAQEPILWGEMFGGSSAEPEETNLKIGMRPFPSSASPIRALQRLVWVELDGQRFNDFSSLRIDGDPAVSRLSVEIRFIGTSGLVPDPI